jgi:hypothetical protein
MLAIPLPKTQADLLRSLFKKTYNKPLTIKFLHLTLVPPFSFTPPLPLPDLTLPADQTYHFGPPALFTQHQRRIFYLPVLPALPLKEAHDRLTRALKDHISLDTAPYSDHKIPAFLPHVTLDYKFTADPAAFTAPTTSFTLPAVQLLQERGPGLWEKAAI